MHILIISSSKKTIAHLDGLNNIAGVEIHYVTEVENNGNKPLNFDLVFLDHKLEQEKIIKRIANLQQQLAEQSHWLVFNLENNIQQSLQYLQAGASGIVYKLTSSKLREIIQVLSQQPIYLEPELTQILALRQIKKIISPFNQLSAREFDVFCLLSENYSIQSIAEVLSITSKTIFNCQTQIRSKLNLKNQQEIALFAKKHRLIESKSL